MIRLILVWAATLFLPLAIFFEPARNAVRVVRNPKTVEGTVAELLPGDHRSVVIRYEIGGRTYQSSTSLPESVGLPRFDDIRVGDRARITYSPQHPEIGISGDPKRPLIDTEEDFALVALGLLVFSVVLELYLRKWLLQWRTQ